MITFDQLRTALLDPQPHPALDRLIRAELAAGRKMQAIYDELLGYIDSVREMPEYTDELEDPLGDKMDALCGWVHKDYAFRDPPETSPPADSGTNGQPPIRTPRHVP
jgi:hypothetical protein